MSEGESESFEVESHRVRTLIKDLDTENMLGHLRNFPRDLENWLLRKNYDEYEWCEDIISKAWKGIVCIGMGGSAAGGMYLSSLANQEGSHPVCVWNNYGLPNWWDPEWLVIAISYSGNTEETLDGVEKAISNGGTVMAITSGGMLSGICELNENANLIHLKAGQPPRSAFGKIFGSMLGFCWHVGLIDKPKEFEIREMIENLGQWVQECDFWDYERNDIILLASEIEDKIIAIISGPEMEAVSYRMKCQFNENSARFARVGIIPEMNHNELVSWGGLKHDADLKIDEQAVLILNWDGEKENNKKRINWFVNNLRSDSAWSLNGEGGTLLEAMLYHSVMMDWLSCAIAFLRGKDPTSIEPIIELKKYLTDVK